MQKILSEDENLNFKDFLANLVVPSTHEDQKDSVFFEFKEWIDSGFMGIPSSEVQRLVDKNIPLWLKNFIYLEDFFGRLYEINKKELCFRLSLVVVKDTVEKYWYDKNDKRPMQAVNLAEKWLKDENSVTKQELKNAAREAQDAKLEKYRSFSYSRYCSYSATYVAYTAQALALAAVVEEKESYWLQKTIVWAVEARGNEEIFKVVTENLPCFCYEDLLRWGYFQPYRKQLTALRT